jgi:imidazolonepropionase-like amidohydrolase
MTILFENCAIFDGQSPDLREGQTVVVEDGRIKEIVDGSVTGLADAQRVAVNGRTLMPGLIDAHFHALLADLNIPSLDDMPASLLHQHARHNLEAVLNRGFTTVRDAGGADLGLCLAVERGLIAGPRILFAGRSLSQTGGHGDMRSQTRFEPCGCSAYRGAISLVTDGVDALRAAVREELRKGAHQIKLMVSGGVLSPTDPIWMDQYSDEEIRVAVEEAATRRTYVMAHAHTASSVRRCAALGVRSIEHGTQIDPDSAAEAAAAGAFVVPTLVTLFAMIESGTEYGLPKKFADKLQGLGDEGLRSLEICRDAGVKVGFGTDLLGPLQDRQCQEFLIRSDVLAPIDILRSATSINAELINRVGDLGIVAAGATADLLVVDGNPLGDLGLLQEQGRHIPVIMKEGRFHKNTL